MKKVEAYQAQQQEFESLIREMDDMAQDISSYVNFLVGRQSALGQLLSSSISNHN